MDSWKVFLHLLCDSRELPSFFVEVKGDVHPLWFSRDMSFICCGLKRCVFIRKLFLLLFEISIYF